MRFFWRWFRRRNWEQDLSEELRFHLEQQTAANIVRGMAPEDAGRRAVLQLGALEGVKEDCREQRRGFWLETLSADVRYGSRMLRKSQGFTTVAILTLALGIGANTALFSVVNGVLLNPLPYSQPEQLVTLHESKPNFPEGAIPYPNFRDWQKGNHTFAAIAIYRGRSFSLTGLGEAERASGEYVSSDFFSLLGVHPVVGRDFASGEDEIGAAPVALISAGFWKRKLGGSPDIVGKTIALDGKGYIVVGVIPAGFELSLRNFQAGAGDVYIPIGQWDTPALRNRYAGLGIHGIGRLKPGVTIEQARADLAGVSQILATLYPKEDQGVGATLNPLKQEMVGDVRPFLLVLFAAVGFVLLIACVNVANLLLARSTSRSREFAIRSALGAGHFRLVRQLLTESLLLAIAGGTLGSLLAAWGTKAALKHLPETLPRAGHVGIDARVLIFTASISVLAGILFGLAPAFRTSQPMLLETLKEGGRGSSGARHRPQAVFVVVEMALSLVLLIGAGLMIRTMAQLARIQPGFEPHNVLLFGVAPAPSLKGQGLDAIRAALREVHRGIESVPKVQAVSLSCGALPISGDDEQLFWLEGQPKPASSNDMNWSLQYLVEPGYLDAMQIPLRAGRFLTPQDTESSARVAVIDDAFARKYFPNENPIGKRLHLENAEAVAEIVGVVGHVKQWSLDADDQQPLQAQMYLPLMQIPEPAMKQVAAAVDVVVRTAGPPLGVLDSIREALREVNSEQIVFDVQTMNENIAASLAPRRFSMILLGAFAVLALVLSSVGIYGVISQIVGQRTHEIGIRMALGAQRNDVLRLVLGGGTRLALIGVGIGIVAALGLTRLMANLLYGVSPTDPFTFVGVALVLTLVALAACYLPARRAMKVDPLVALRYE
jgi:predicted permease